MGIEGETEARKPRHYNISMSRRTRRPQNSKMEKQKRLEERENEVMMRGENQKSLKQLIEIEERVSLEQHLREEEEAGKEKEVVEESAVVRPADGDGDQRLRLKRPTTTVMRKCAQILSHLIKVKQESYIRSWRKSALLSVKLINHN